MAASPRQDGDAFVGSAGPASSQLPAEIPGSPRGTPREEIRVLIGNPEADAKLIDNLTFRNRYSSGVIAWAPEDRPTDEQVMAVLHREKGGGVHVHVVVPMVERRAGKVSMWHRPVGSTISIRWLKCTISAMARPGLMIRLGEGW
ncbi:MAG: hypothetical protein OXC57_07675 [Rhodobacteraceae bacterium]|nr:hypothetical protein [Paracoccaceae bacterium]